MEGEIAVRRHQVRVVIARFGVDVIAPRRLQADRHVAAAKGRHGEMAAVERARAEEGIGFRRAPTVDHRVLHGPGQAAEEHLVFVEGQGFVPGAGRQRPQVVGRPGQQPLHQGVAVGRNITQRVSRRRHVVQQLDRRRRGVQTNTIADAPVAVGIVGEHQGNAAVGPRFLCKPRPAGRQIRHEIDAVGNRLIPHDVGLRRLVAPGPALERHGAGEDAPVHFRQGHVHGDVAGAKAEGPRFPAFPVAAGKHGLQHRRPRLVQRPRRAPAAELVRARRGDGKARGVQDDRGRRVGEKPFQRRRRDRVLQAFHVDRQSVEPGPAQGFDQGIDRVQIARLQQRAVEHQPSHGGIVHPMAAQCLQIGHRLTGPIKPTSHKRLRLQPVIFAADQRRGIIQEPPRVGGPALHQILP